MVDFYGFHVGPGNIPVPWILWVIVFFLILHRCITQHDGFACDVATPRKVTMMGSYSMKIRAESCKNTNEGRLGVYFGQGVFP